MNEQKQKQQKQQKTQIGNKKTKNKRKRKKAQRLQHKSWLVRRICLHDRLVLSNWLVYWLVGWLFGWLAGWLDECLVWFGLVRFSSVALAVCRTMPSKGSLFSRPGMNKTLITRLLQLIDNWSVVLFVCLFVCLFACLPACLSSTQRWLFCRYITESERLSVPSTLYKH